MKNLKLLREIVFGTQDGVISTLVVILALAIHDEDLETVILAGIATMLAGTFSMGIGSYLASRTDGDVESVTSVHHQGYFWDSVVHGLTMCLSFLIASLVPIVSYWLGGKYSMDYHCFIGIFNSVRRSKSISSK